MKYGAALGFLLTLMGGTASFAGELSRGVAQISEDGRMSVDGTQLRLLGVVLPSVDARCGHDDGVWPCGQAAIAAFKSFVANKEVVCTSPEGETGLCFVEGKDVALWLVMEGWAESGHSHRTYEEAKAEALKLKRGVWRDGAGYAPWRALK